MAVGSVVLLLERQGEEMGRELARISWPEMEVVEGEAK